MKAAKSKKKHIARPMDAYEKEKKLRCIDNPNTKFRREAVLNTTHYRSVKEVMAEFELIAIPDINSTIETF
jgi:hypothetical protein